MQLEYAKDPRWVNAEHTMIDLTIKWVEIDEELPFTASPDDCEEHGCAIFAAAVAGEYGAVAEFVPYVPTQEEKAAAIRAERDALLAASDWTQLLDARTAMGEAKAAEWDAYRQALRDVPQQSGFPDVVEWPIKPE
jgi:hypothetical protein